MSFGKMNATADIVEIRRAKDSEGFVSGEERVLASVRVYREGRHGSTRGVNLFRFRCIPGVTVSTEHTLVCGGERFSILSVENVRGRGMYTEVLARKVVPTSGKG